MTAIVIDGDGRDGSVGLAFDHKHRSSKREFGTKLRSKELGAIKGVCFFCLIRASIRSEACTQSFRKVKRPRSVARNRLHPRPSRLRIKDAPLSPPRWNESFVRTSRTMNRSFRSLHEATSSTSSSTSAIHRFDTSGPHGIPSRECTPLPGGIRIPGLRLALSPKDPSKASAVGATAMQALAKAPVFVLRTDQTCKSSKRRTRRSETSTFLRSVREDADKEGIKSRVGR